MLACMKLIERPSGLDDWRVLCQYLPDQWQAAAKHTGALRRARGIADAEMLLRVLLVHLADGCSLKETAVRVGQAGWCTISPVALFKRLRAAEEWLRWMAERLWRHESGPLAKVSYRVRAVDATTVQEPGSTGTDWRVHYVINLVNLQCDHYELTDVKGGETFRRIPVRSGDLMMGDRAYGTPPGVAHVMKEGGAVLSRITLHNMPLYTESGKKMPVLSRLRTVHVGQVREWAAWVRTGNESFSGRLVAVKRGRQAIKEAEARVLRRANRKQQSVSAETLAAAAYVFVWTSVPATVIDANKIMEIYRLRWQIELAFKRMKSIMGLGHLPKWSDASARAWIHGKLFVALLIERLLDAAETVSPWGYRLDASPEPMA